VVAVGIDRLDEGGKPPVPRDRDDLPIVAPPSTPRDSIMRPESRDQKTYDAELRRAVHAEHETEREPTGAALGAWHSDGGCSLNPGESADRTAYLVHYRTLVDAEYRDAHSASGKDLPALRQAWADHEKKLLHADADPLRVLGPAYETHPAELQAAMVRLVGAGVEVDMRRGSMSYSPSAVAGHPGRLILDPEASYGAVLHETSHFSDDEAAGFPGLRYWLEDPTVTAAGESKAYQAEIDYANSIGETGIVSQLEELRAQRISQLLGENDG
jgi:hypothetical protein